MPFSSGNFKTTVTVISVLLTLATAAVGYGELRKQVSDLHDDVAAVQVDINLAKTNPTASAAGALLQGQITELNHRLDRVEQKEDEILRQLSRIR